MAFSAVALRTVSEHERARSSHFPSQNGDIIHVIHHTHTHTDPPPQTRSPHLRGLELVVPAGRRQLIAPS